MIAEREIDAVDAGFDEGRIGCGVYLSIAELQHGAHIRSKVGRLWRGGGPSRGFRASRRRRRRAGMAG